MTQADDGVEQEARVASHASVGVAEPDHSLTRQEISDYLDGSLAGSDHDRVHRHLGECRACAAYLATIRQTVELLGQLPPRSAPSDAKAAIARRAHRPA